MYQVFMYNFKYRVWFPALDNYYTKRDAQIFLLKLQDHSDTVYKIKKVR